MPTKTTVNAVDTAELYVQNVFHLHGLRPAGGDPGLDHLQKYFFDSLCFLEWTWPF